MVQGSKRLYTAKQKRKAESIEEGYRQKGVPVEEAEARAWATVNKHSGGGERAGGAGAKESPRAKRRARTASAKRAAATRREDASQGALASMGKASLMAEARKRGIKGRSRMRKQELIVALRKSA